MANWALVIGINQYLQPGLSLKGAVHDAIRMRDWLLKEGDVPDSNLFLMLSPSPANALPAGLTFDDPTKDNIIDVIATKLVAQSKGAGERFYFYYSGHGLQDRINFSDESAIVAKDFTLLHTDKTFGLSSIRDYFKATQFRDQFYFIDACRNFPDPTGKNEFRIGEWPRPQKIDPSLPAVQQFVFYATSSGVQAIELQDANNERGAFTDVLLEGLQGKGRAKAWDVASQQYIVRVGGLFDYVKDEVISKRLKVPSGTARDLYQIPRIDGERGGDRSSNPIMARFDPEVIAIPDVSLEVQITPFKTESEIAVAIERDGVAIAKQTQVAQLPVRFALQPKEYSVRATAIDQDPGQKRWSVELYDPQELMLTMVPKAVSPTTGSTTASVGFDEAIAKVDASESTAGAIHALPQLGFEAGASTLAVSPEAGSAAEDGQLIVESADPLAALEIADNTGHVISSGEGRLEALDLKPGFYKARLVTPETPPVEKLIELSQGEKEEVPLDAPSSPLTKLHSEIIKAADFLIMDDNTLDVSSTVGPMASARLSTVLMLAGSVVNKDQTWGKRLRSIGLASFRDSVPAGTQSGLQILAAVEPATGGDIGAYVSAVKLRVWPYDKPTPEASEQATSLPTIAAIAEFIKATESGPHWLSIELPDQPPVVFALAMLPQRLSMMIFHLASADHVGILQYMPGFANDEPLGPVTLRRLELMQRFYVRNRLDYAYEQAKVLIGGDWIEPLAGCLAGYLLLRLKKVDELGSLVEKLVNLYPQIPDSHVLRAEHAASQNNADAASSATVDALDRGVPVFADGLARLYDNVTLYKLAHPLAPLLSHVFERRVRNLLWTSWQPGANEVLPGISVSGREV